MPERPVFDSRDPRYKTPYGAVPAGTNVTFTLRPDRSEGFSRGWLTARLEQRENLLVTAELPRAGTEGEADLFTGTLDTGDYVGLIWYTFSLEREDGTRLDLEEEHQLTVYDGSEQVPGWFGQGMSYQIFPDRFRRTCVPSAAGMVGGRQVHTAWQEFPEYRPDSRGEIRNRDFFGGNLAGVEEKLDYLQELGVETLYFCPIFEAAENHRYGTADYERIDPMLGTEEDFSRLCREAHRRGMRVMLDGVFNHTGFVSRYFNGDGFYPGPGASQSRESPYYSWFQFRRWPDWYDSWWGIYSLPAVNENDPGYREYIFGGEDSIVRRWLRAGADGWRLDVADELPDDFVAGIHAAARAEKPDAVIIGEVWEDGSTKIAYGVRRKHIWGRHCDGLMNYPFRTAALEYFQGGDAKNFVSAMERLRENYPPFAFRSAMNSLGTHDTPRALTLLGVGPCAEQDRDWRAGFRMDAGQRALASERLKAASALLFAFPGSPTVYYGDEAGLEGFEDPFNRRTYPWGEEDRALLDWYRRLGALRRESPALRRGDIRFLRGEGPLLVFVRSCPEETVLAAFHAGDEPLETALELPEGERLAGPGTLARGTLTLPPRSGTLWRLAHD